MSDIAGKMAEWRKTVWGTGPCPVPSQENLTLTDEEREAVEWAASRGDEEAKNADKAADLKYKVQECRQWAENHRRRAATLRGLLERTK
jgi:hypothetical protein